MRKALLLCFVLFISISICYANQDVDNYCYSKLSLREQLAYEAMFECITTLTSRWNCGSFSQETLKKAYDCLLLDHPELFWSDSFTYVTSYVNNSISTRYVEFEYTMTLSQIEKTNKEIENALFSLVKEIGTAEQSYETVRKVYAWLVKNCSYDKTNMDQTLYSVMVQKSGVCASFSKAFEFIMQCLGIPCTCINGKLKTGSNLLASSSNLGHEWNLVFINGSWAHVDITSAISLSEDGVDYSFFCCTTDEILKTHIIDNVVEIPVCDDTSLDVFTYYNLYVNEYSKSNVLEAFYNSISLGMAPQVRFSSYRTFLEAKEDLINNAGLFEVVESLTSTKHESLNYYLDETTLCIELSNIGL